MSRPVPMCPVRPGDPCSLCVPGARGPADCAVVSLVMSDPDLRAQLAELRRQARGPERQQVRASASLS